MNHVVLKLSLVEIAEMKKHYQAYLSANVPAGGIFAAKTPSCTITAYKSGKVLFQGGASTKEASLWGTAAENTKKASAKKVTPTNHLPAHFEQLSVIGSDEVGTGDYFGPITVVAAYVKKEDIPLLKELGVKDSKNLTDDKISEIAKQIKEVIPYSLLTLHNEKYNRLQQSGMSQGKLKALLHNQAILHVLNKISPVQPEAILIDQFAKKEVYYNYLKGQEHVQTERVFFSTKGESIHLAVAAASILARYAFIQHFEQLSQLAGFPLQKGAGPKVDEIAARLIIEKGKDLLPQFVKLHFANTEKAWKIVRKKS